MNKAGAVYQVDNKISGRGAGVRMPSDGMSRKERLEMNGDCMTYRTGVPVTYEEFSAWPEDVQKEYMKKIYWTHGGTARSIGNMFGVSDFTVCQILKKLGVPARKPGEHPQRGQFEAWLLNGRKTTLKEIIPEKQMAELKAIAEPPKQEHKPEQKPEPPKAEEKKTGNTILALAALLDNLKGSGTKIHIELEL